MCNVVDQAKARHEKAPDERAAERMKRQWQMDLQEMRNSKNNYVLAVVVANAHKNKYYQVDTPQLMDEMQALNESRIHLTKVLFEQFVQLERDSLNQSQNVVDVIVGAV